MKLSQGNYEQELRLERKREDQLARGIIVDKKRLAAQYIAFCGYQKHPAFRASVYAGAKIQAVWGGN